MSHRESSEREAQPRRRPRVVAAGTLGAAGIGAGLVLALSGTAAAKPAYSIKVQTHNSVLVRIDSGKTYLDADRRMIARYHEEFTIFMARGVAKHKTPVTCRPEGRPRPKGPTVRILVGKNGTERPSASAGNTGASGPYHLASCDVYAARTDHSGNTGNTGNTGNR